MSTKSNGAIGYLPDERPTTGKLLAFALQQLLVMFPATVLVAILTGFHISTTIFASGLATLCFLFITRGKLPLYYGSSFSYITAIVSITGPATLWNNGVAPDALLSKAQFGVIMSGLISIAAGLVVNFFGTHKIEKVLPPTVTGSIAIVIGISLAGTAMQDAAGVSAPHLNQDYTWLVALVTLLATVLFSVYLKGTLGQLPILFGMIIGYLLSLALGMLDFSTVFTGEIIKVPHFTLPTPNLSAVLAIMPIAIATIPESTAHLYQLDIYVDHLAKEKGKASYGIKDKLGLNLIGDGIGDMIASLIGGPAGTNYGENLSTQAITRNFSTAVLRLAAIIAMAVSFFDPLSKLISSIPRPVIGGVSIYLFGVIGAQGIAIMINRNVDLFNARNLAVIATILVIGLGGSYGFPGGMIPFFGTQLPAIATASVVGILLNTIMYIGKKDETLPGRQGN